MMAAAYATGAPLVCTAFTWQSEMGVRMELGVHMEMRMQLRMQIGMAVRVSCSHIQRQC